MKLDRQNILDLIGRNQSKYSSCIITCFSFDFTFFEQRVMAVLRSANIRNVNVFVDDKYLDNALENSEGGEFQIHKTYSVNGIRANGVFHPKIMLLTGPKHGLLVIGSGNLTNSGLSSNDEVWGAFHLKGIDSQNAPLFAQVWRYLELFMNQTDGINAEKLFWIKQRALWIDELLNASFPEKIQVDKSTSIQFLANTKQNSLYNQLLDRLPKKPLQEINIVSPYFDEKGTFLKNILEDLNAPIINCITDPQFGRLPTQIDDETLEKTNFYAWSDCMAEATELSRLHAKIFQFKYQDGTEYLLFGSANATRQAFGGLTTKAANEEACLLINNEANPDYLSSMGVDWSEASTIVIKEQKKSKNSGDSVTSIKIQTRIKHAEFKDDRLTVYFQNNPSGSEKLIVVNKFGGEEFSSELSEELVQIFRLSKTDQLNRIYLSLEDERVSNYALVHDVGSQEKSNPDPKQAEINQLLEDLEDDPEGSSYIALLKHTDYNWVDSEIDRKSTSTVTNRKPSEIEEVKEYDQIDQNKFYALSTVESSQAVLLRDSGVRISDVLSVISKGRLNKKEDVSESEEDRLAIESAEEQTGEGGIVSSGKSIVHDGVAERTAIHAYLKKSLDFYKGQLQELKSERSIKFSPARELQLNDYSNLSIALDLINIFSSKTFKTEKVIVGLFDSKDVRKAIEKIQYTCGLERINRANRDYPTLVYFYVQPKKIKEFIESVSKVKDLKIWAQDEYESQITEHRYFFSGEASGGKGHGVLFYLSNILGSFLIGSNAGAKDYSYQLVNDKIGLLQKEIFERSISLILNNRWKEKDEKYRRLLILDLLHFICPTDWRKKDEQEIRELFLRLNARNETSSPYFENNLNYFLSTLETYEDWYTMFNSGDRSNLITPKSELRNGQIVFGSKIGFSMLKMVKDNAMLLMKPGFDWNEMHKEYILNMNYPQEKVIIL
jgi:hypothetical protein